MWTSTTSYGRAGIGTPNHLCGEWLSHRLGLKLSHVSVHGRGAGHHRRAGRPHPMTLMLILQELHQVTVLALNDAAVRQKPVGLRSEPDWRSPAQFATFLASGQERWGDTVRAADPVGS